MELITKDYILESLSHRWQTQYPKSRQLFDGRWTGDILNAIELEKELTEERALEIIGTNWTENKCDECKKDVQAVVQLGDEPDYESSTASICLDCLKTAVGIIKTT